MYILFHPIITSRHIINNIKGKTSPIQAVNMKMVTPKELKKKFIESYCNLTDQKYGNLYQTHSHVKKYPLEKVYAKNESPIHTNKSTSYQILFNKHFNTTINSPQVNDIYHINKKIIKNSTRQIYRSSRHKNSLFRSKLDCRTQRKNDQFQFEINNDKNKSLSTTIQMPCNILLINNKDIRSMEPKNSSLSHNNTENKQGSSLDTELQINKFPLLRKKETKRKQTMINFSETPPLFVRTNVTKPKQKLSFYLNKTSAVKFEMRKSIVKELSGWEIQEMNDL